MRTLLAILVAVLLCGDRRPRPAGAAEISCSELKDTVLGSFIISLSSRRKDTVQVDFFLSTNRNRLPVQLVQNDRSTLDKSSFDPSKKTYVLVHGYKSGGRKRWVLEMKEALLDYADVNVILVDWSDGSNNKNYVDSARNTESTTNRIFNFLQVLKQDLIALNRTSADSLWNHLYFIGHSLGAQVSGQTAHLLKQDSFWRVERITGLDPAKPCFENIDSSLKLDEDDADFVDAIHTQTGKGGNTDGLGLMENVGHIDFYVNGGITQPGCIGSTFTPRWNTMICSHRLSYKYFTESVRNAARKNNCLFRSFRWDGTYEDAQRILEAKLARSSCSDCPIMGIDAVLSKERGTFLVITSAKEPFCEFEEETGKDVSNIFKVIGRLKGIKSIFDSRKANKTEKKEEKTF